MTDRLRDDVAWEYLDDGGVLFVQISEGAYWQLGPPSGPLLAHLLRPNTGQSWERLAEALELLPVEAPAALEAFRETLVALALLINPTELAE